jgi:hypothetical protein
MSESWWTVPHAPATPFCVKNVAIPPVIRPVRLPLLLPSPLPDEDLGVDLGVEEVVVVVGVGVVGDLTLGAGAFGVSAGCVDEEEEELDLGSGALGRASFGADPDLGVAVWDGLGSSSQSVSPLEPGSRVDVG